MAALQNAPLLVRVIVYTGAFALLGLVVSAAIAWVCAAAEFGQHVGGRRIQLATGSINLEQYSGFGMEGVDWFAIKGSDTEDRAWELPGVYPAWVPRWSSIHDMSASDMEESGAFQRTERAYGWPMLAFHSTTRADLAIDWKQRSLPTHGLTGEDRAAEAWSLRPLWRGLAVNSLIFAAGPWLLFFAPFQLVHLVRAMQGRCPACAYPVGVSDVCTECGKRLPPQLRRRSMKQA